MEDHGNTSDNMIDKIYLLEYNKIRREQIFYSHVICLDLLKQGFMPKSEAPMGASFFFMGENMAFRVVLIENEVTIKVKLNNLIVTKEGEDLWIPLDDISMIVMDNLSSMLSARLLCQLSEQGIGLMICNQKHLPTGYYSSYDNHSRASKVIGYQIEKSKRIL